MRIRRVKDGKVTRFVTIGYCHSCGGFHSVDAHRENHCRVGFQQSLEVCKSQSNQAATEAVVVEGVMAS